MVMIERLLQPAASAISEVVSGLLFIISRIITCLAGAGGEPTLVAYVP
jgi:hypothetical protein